MTECQKGTKRQEKKYGYKCRCGPNHYGSMVHVLQFGPTQPMPSSLLLLSQPPSSKGESGRHDGNRMMGRLGISPWAAFGKDRDSDGGLFVVNEWHTHTHSGKNYGTSGSGAGRELDAPFARTDTVTLVNRRKRRCGSSVHHPFSLITFSFNAT